MYQERSYRSLHSSELFSFQVKHEACDLWLAISQSVYTTDLPAQCQILIRVLWQELYNYIINDSEFANSLVPYAPAAHAPHCAQQMAVASAKAAVGPMAAVAGYFAQALGQYLLQQLNPADLIIENGGDLWLHTSKPRLIALHAGTSPLSGKLALEIPASTALSICTSSGTVGHSLSFGQADAVTVVAADATIADAFATAIANKIKSPADISRELDSLPSEILGCVIIIGEHIGAKGEVKLVRI